MIVYIIETRHKNYTETVITASYVRAQNELNTVDAREVTVIVTPYKVEDFKELEKENAELIEKYRQAVDKCLHITFIGCGCEVHTIAEYATLVDGYLTDVEGLAKWKN